MDEEKMDKQLYINNFYHKNKSILDNTKKNGHGKFIIPLSNT
jgi:hypothetical protein